MTFLMQISLEKVDLVLFTRYYYINFIKTVHQNVSFNSKNWGMFL